MNRPAETMGDFMAEHEARLIAEALTPERIAADADLIRRNSERAAAEVASLRRQGLIDDGSAHDDDPDEDEGCVQHKDDGRGRCCYCDAFI